MARLTRLLVPSHPHNVTQRGVRRLKTIFWRHVLGQAPPVDKIERLRLNTGSGRPLGDAVKIEALEY